MRMVRMGALVGGWISILLFPCMYFAVTHPRSSYSAIVYLIGSVLWPGSLMLMAVQGPGITLFGVLIFVLAVLSNCLLYALLLGLAGIALRRIGVLRR